MKTGKKSEWFELDSPIAEPNIKYRQDSYWIERLTKDNGDVVWFGQDVNWQKLNGGEWTVLGVDKNIKPIETFYNTDGSIDGYTYPEGRQIWIECDLPIYEKLYIDIKKNGK